MVFICSLIPYLLRAVTNQKMSDMHGSTMMHITMGDMNKTKIPIPPLSEQQQIATYLDTKCSKIDHIIATQKKKIAYLQELKQSLITNVVTGKIKVS
ncbi:restriction endonuclease subunit S [Phocaeicola dorei]|uniref:restriction endonuclease subunit S n=1 Tax=Phocaeicola dorei TaxID=357276 RepID=UPI0009B5F3D5|nr:restriction endonuclease subunit S [Phocaeicola dorei]